MSWFIKTIFVFALFSCLIFASARNAYAVSVTITDFPSTISSDPFNVSVSIVGAGAGTNYLRVDLFQTETTNYFGETFNNTSWYGGSDGTQYFPVAISSGTAAPATFQGRVGSPDGGKYVGPGMYKLKIRRYTSSGSQANDQQTPVDINITIPTPAPTPTSTPTSTPTPTSAPPTEATYKINDVKDQDGNTLSSVQIYIDGVYIHHYTPETITFCDNCTCDTYVNCNFGSHTISLKKGGYGDWSEMKTISLGGFYEINPIMYVINQTSSTSSTPTPSPTPTPAKSPTPNPNSLGKILLTAASTVAGYLQTASNAGTVAGMMSSIQAEEKFSSPSSQGKNYLLPILLGLGSLAVLGMAVSAFWIQRKNKV